MDGSSAVGYSPELANKYQGGVDGYRSSKQIATASYRAATSTKASALSANAATVALLPTDQGQETGAAGRDLFVIPIAIMAGARVQMPVASASEWTR